MINRKHPGMCPECEARLEIGPAFRELGKLVPIGEPVMYRTSKPVMRTEYQHYQCSICGETWCRVEDSGFGGHGWFLHLMVLK